jgi:hypothetical protein
MIETCSFDEIQTPKIVWERILEYFPIVYNDIFFEPFKGAGSLYDLVDCKKEWCEITQDKNIFDYDFKTSVVTKLYTNPPFKAMIPTNKKGKLTFKYKNCVYFFLEYFMINLPLLVECGFLMNAKSFQSLTPKRLAKLNELGFYIHNVVCLNIQKWYGLYYFVLFKKQKNNLFIGIKEYF